MFTHCVFFWLKKDLTAAQLAGFDTAVKTLTKIPGVVTGTVGHPATTNRPVIDRSYSYGLMLVFKDLAGHDAYQVHATHDAFHTKYVKYWDRVQVYDFE